MGTLVTGETQTLRTNSNAREQNERNIRRGTYKAPRRHDSKHPNTNEEARGAIMVQLCRNQVPDSFQLTSGHQNLELIKN